MNPGTYLIVRHGGIGAALPAQPVAGLWYFGIHADGSTGALAQWNGYSFTNSESDDMNMGIYCHLQEMPPRG